MKKTDNNRRRDFLKKIPYAIASVGAFSYFKIKKSYNLSGKKFNTLSKFETDEIIKEEKFSTSIHIKPESAPIGRKNING